MAELKHQHSWHISVLYFPKFLLYLVYGSGGEKATLLFSSVYSFSASVPFLSSPFLKDGHIMGYNPWSIDLFQCFLGMYLALLKIRHCVVSRWCSEQRCTVWVNPEKEHLVWQVCPEHQAAPLLTVSAHPLPQSPWLWLVVVVASFIFWHLHSICLPQDVTDRVFLLHHVERKYSLC